MKVSLVLSRRVACLMAAWIAFSLAGCDERSTGARQPRVLQGTVDCTAWDFNTMGSIPLRGDWEFYRNRLLSPQDFQAQKTPAGMTCIPVPRVWNGYRLNGETLTGDGFGTYRVLVRTPDTSILALSRMHPNTAFALWINGRRYAGAGRVGDSPKNAAPGQNSHLTFFKGSGSVNEIIIQVSNYSYAIGGIWNTPYLGSAAVIQGRQANGIAHDLFLFGTMLIIGLYHFSLALLRKRNSAAVWFGLLSALLALRCLVTNSVYLLLLFPGFPWEALVALNYLSFLLPCAVCIVFINKLYPGTILEKCNMVMVLAFIAWAFLVLLLPARLYSKLLLPMHLCILVGGGCLLATITQAITRKTDGAIMNGVAFCILFLAGIHDMFLANGIMESLQLMPLGFLAFTFSESYLLSERFSRAFDKVEELSLTLDHKVRFRTAELEEEKNRLKQRNQEIEKELNMARNIQQQMIPSVTPAPYIGALYIPMEKVGGDFYDFFRIGDSDEIGIFVSDVSGHGVPAAFITSMVKTAILQAGNRRENPAELLHFLNEHLLPLTGGNFITAFYGIFNPHTRTLRYANAGHIPPYVIVNGSVSVMDGRRTIPLGLMDSAGMHEYKKYFVNNEITLEQNSKILLYTDGLTETRNANDGSLLFEDELLNGVLANLAHYQPRKFVEALYLQLTDFRESNQFEDDICIICVDVE